MYSLGRYVSTGSGCHHLGQGSPRFTKPYGVTRLQWVNSILFILMARHRRWQFGQIFLRWLFVIFCRTSLELFSIVWFMNYRWFKWYLSKNHATMYKLKTHLAIPTRITSRAWRTCRDACRDRSNESVGRGSVIGTKIKIGIFLAYWITVATILSIPILINIHDMLITRYHMNHAISYRFSHGPP